jgi:hypothetical protein
MRVQILARGPTILYDCRCSYFSSGHLAKYVVGSTISSLGPDRMFPDFSKLLTHFVRLEVFTAVTMKNGVCWMLRLVALLRTDVSEELSDSFIRATRISELGTTLAITSNRRTLHRNTIWIVCSPAEGGAKFLQNVSFYKSHTA